MEKFEVEICALFLLSRTSAAPSSNRMRRSEMLTVRAAAFASARDVMLIFNAAFIPASVTSTYVTFVHDLSTEKGPPDASVVLIIVHGRSAPLTRHKNMHIVYTTSIIVKSPSLIEVALNGLRFKRGAGDSLARSNGFHSLGPRCASLFKALYSMTRGIESRVEVQVSAASVA